MSGNPAVSLARDPKQCDLLTRLAISEAGLGTDSKVSVPKKCGSKRRSNSQLVRTVVATPFSPSQG